MAKVKKGKGPSAKDLELLELRRVYAGSSRRHTTRDTVLEKRARVLAWFSKKENWRYSNYDAAIVLGVDESMVRRYRASLGVPGYERATGEMSPELAEQLGIRPIRKKTGPKPKK